MSPETIALQIPGLKLSARAWGPSGGAPVLALHGWLDNACSFDALAPRLPDCRIVALDLPGHGRSEHHASGHPYAFLDLVSEVHWAVEALGWSRFVLLGHSLGAAIASVLAGTFPERILRLMLLDGIGPTTESAEGAPSRLARALVDQQRRARAGSVAPVLRRRQQLVDLAQAARDMDPSSVETLLAGGIAERAEGYTWSSDPVLRLSSRQRLTEDQVLAFLANIACPTLLIRALDGIAFDAEVVARRMAAVPKLRVHEVPGRHHVHLDAPERIVPLLLAFMNEEDIP